MQKVWICRAGCSCPASDAEGVYPKGFAKENSVIQEGPSLWCKELGALGTDLQNQMCCFRV